MVATLLDRAVCLLGKTLLQVDGIKATYRERGTAVDREFCMSRARLQPLTVQGVEVNPVDFTGLSSDFTPNPKIGDLITFDSIVYQVQPTESRFCFRRIRDPLTRVHTIQRTGFEATYSDGTTSATVFAIPSIPNLSRISPDVAGIRLAEVEISWLVLRTEFETTPPKRGDTITFNGIKFVVMPNTQDQQTYEQPEPFGANMIIHTKQRP